MASSGGGGRGGEGCTSDGTGGRGEGSAAVGSVSAAVRPGPGEPSSSGEPLSGKERVQQGHATTQSLTDNHADESSNHETKSTSDKDSGVHIVETSIQSTNKISDIETVNKIYTKEEINFGESKGSEIVAREELKIEKEKLENNNYDSKISEILYVHTPSSAEKKREIETGKFTEIAVQSLQQEGELFTLISDSQDETSKEEEIKHDVDILIIEAVESGKLSGRRSSKFEIVNEIIDSPKHENNKNILVRRDSKFEIVNEKSENIDSTKYEFEIVKESIVSNNKKQERLLERSDSEFRIENETGHKYNMQYSKTLPDDVDNIETKIIQRIPHREPEFKIENEVNTSSVQEEKYFEKNYNPNSSKFISNNTLSNLKAEPKEEHSNKLISEDHTFNISERIDTGLITRAETELKHIGLDEDTTEENSQFTGDISDILYIYSDGEGLENESVNDANIYQKQNSLAKEIENYWNKKPDSESKFPKNSEGKENENQNVPGSNLSASKKQIKTDRNILSSQIPISNKTEFISNENSEILVIHDTEDEYVPEKSKSRNKNSSYRHMSKINRPKIEGKMANGGATKKAIKNK
ncbi:unnamed protein product, partial [Meganyctiphanes norvegica]